MRGAWPLPVHLTTLHTSAQHHDHLTEPVVNAAGKNVTRSPDVGGHR